MLTANRTERIEIPHEPGEWADIRMLSWKQREEARQARMNAVLRSVQSMGGDTFRQLREMTADDEEAARKQNEDALQTYDMEAVLRNGLLRLSYAETMGADVIDDLDGDTAEYIARAIIRFSSRAEEEGKGS